MNDVLYSMQDLQERDKDLQGIVSSIQDSQVLMLSISNLVIQQGTLMDRIDRSLDTQKDLLERATKHLLSAEKKRWCSRVGCCLFFVVFVFVITFLALFAKLAWKYGPTIIKLILTIIAL